MGGTITKGILELSKHTGIRTTVIEFAINMEMVLSQNDNKGGWDNCKAGYLWNRLLDEIEELKMAKVNYGLDRNKFHEVKKECIDVANFAMMIWDNSI